MTDNNNTKRLAHCRACDRVFDVFARTVEGPNGPIKIEEDLCKLCRRRALVWFDHEDNDALQAIEEEVDLLFLNKTGRKRENQT